MFKKVKEFFIKRKQNKEQKTELLKMKDYHTKLQNGALFLQYIYTDMAKQQKNMNRTQRRRIDTELKHKGKFSEETIRRYMTQVSEINKYIDIELKKANNDK